MSMRDMVVETAERALRELDADGRAEVLRRLGIVPTLPPDLDAIRKRCDAATPGPWFAVDIGSGNQRVRHRGKGGPFTIASIQSFCSPDADVAFIAHARADVPALLDAVIAERNAARAEVERLRVRVAGLESEGLEFIGQRDRANATAATMANEVDRLHARVVELETETRRQTEKVAQAFREVAAGLTRERDLRATLAVVSTGTEGVWRWQGDGHDDPDSLACPVVMSADTLRGFVAERDRLQAMEKRVIAVVAANGCDCDEGSDDPEDRCVAHRVEDALRGVTP